jgi:5-methylcytosine-specific restriction endonuclease McrA
MASSTRLSTRHFRGVSKYRFPNHHKWRGQKVTSLLARDGFNCTICGEALDRKIVDPANPEYITFDHIQPRSLGGLTDLRNLRLAHRVCNERRGNDPIMPENEQVAA